MLWIAVWLAASALFCGGYVLGAATTRRKVEEETLRR